MAVHLTKGFDATPEPWLEPTKAQGSLLPQFPPCVQCPALQSAPQAAIEELEESALEVHQRAMDSLDDVVTAFMKLKDVEGIHEAARRVNFLAGPCCAVLQPSLCRGRACPRAHEHRKERKNARTCLHAQAHACSNMPFVSDKHVSTHPQYAA